MNLRLIELIAPPEQAKEAREILKDEHIVGIWTDDYEDGCAVVRVLLDFDLTESITDTLADKYENVDGFRIIIFDVEASLPKPEDEEEQSEEDKTTSNRISREELYVDVTEGSNFDWVYVTMVFLSTVVAAFGLIHNEVIAIIGAMVIAPLMGPNVAMALAVTLADEELGWRSIKANIGGLFVVFGTAFVLGLFMSFNLEGGQILSHTAVTFGDLAISMAAGVAGVLAFTVGVPATIIGVAVALALLPALVSFGLLLGGGYTELATGALILTVTNIISINLAGVVTFLIQGVGPREWWEERKAKNATRIAIALWVILLAILAVCIWYWGQFDLQSMIPEPLK